jgi:8-oxo-dGTP diphosphatase
VTILRKAALEVFGRLPVPLRRGAVRVIAPRYVLGTVLALRQDGHVLMLRARHVRFGWTLPGGLVQAGEQPRTALVRELEEELRLDVDVPPDAALVVVDTEARRVDFVFELSVTDRPELTLDHMEVLEARWLPMTSELCDDPTRDVLARLAGR